MDKEALRHCGQCKHFEVDFCLLRQEVIPFPHSTGCASHGQDHKVPRGVLHSIVGEFRSLDRPVFKMLPYLEGHRVETLNLPGQRETKIMVCTPEDDLVFADSDAYLAFREKSLSRPLLLIGALAGDMFGTLPPQKRKQGSSGLLGEVLRFTDQTVAMLGVAKALIRESDHSTEIKALCRRYPNAGYSNEFKAWLNSLDARAFCTDQESVAFRSIPVGYASDSLEKALSEAERSASSSHGQIDSLRSAKAVSGSIYLAKNGASKSEIAAFIKEGIEWALPESLQELLSLASRESNGQIGVREAISCFLLTDDFDSAMRCLSDLNLSNSALFGLVGGLSEACYHGLPEGIRKVVVNALPDELHELLIHFDERFHFDFAGYGSALETNAD